MRRLLYSLLLLAFPAALLAAEPEAKDPQQELHDLEWRLYERVDFPLRVRRLDTEIKLAEARLKSLEKLLAHYLTFQKFGINDGDPLTLTVEDTKLQVMEAKLRLADLKEERLLLDRYKDEQRRLFDLRKDADAVRAKIRLRVD